MRLTDAISPFHRQGALPQLIAALLLIPLHHLHHRGQCPESSLAFHFKGQTSSLHHCHTISFNTKPCAIYLAFPTETYFAAAFV